MIVLLLKSVNLMFDVQRWVCEVSSNRNEVNEFHSF